MHELIMDGMREWEVFSLIETADRFGPNEDVEVFAIRWADTKEPVSFYHLPYRHFLDEIADLNLELHEKMLRIQVLEEAVDDTEYDLDTIMKKLHNIK